MLISEKFLISIVIMKTDNQKYRNKEERQSENHNLAKIPKMN